MTKDVSQRGIVLPSHDLGIPITVASLSGPSCGFRLLSIQPPQSLHPFSICDGLPSRAIPSPREKRRLVPGFTAKAGTDSPDLVLYENAAALVDVNAGFGGRCDGHLSGRQGKARVQVHVGARVHPERPPGDL